MCFGRAFHLILMHFYFLYSMLWGMFSKIRLFFLKSCFSRISINPIWSSINRNHFKKIQWASTWFDWSNLFFDQSNIVNQVFLKQCFDRFKTLFQNFFQTFLSLSLTWQGSTEDFFSFFNQIFAMFFSHKASKTIIPFLLFLFSWFHA